MRSDKQKYPKKIYEVKFEYTTYNKLYLLLDDEKKIESRIRDLNLNLTFKLDDELFDMNVNRDFIFIREKNEVDVEELNSYTQSRYEVQRTFDILKYK